jgi:DNA-binding NarL/FixJ family response regulator
VARSLIGPSMPHITNPPYRVVLTDDHVLVRQALGKIIGSADGLKVVAEASDGLELLALLRQRRRFADLVILDIAMPRLRGIETIRELKVIDATPKILIVSMHRDKEYVSAAMSAGASGYLLKEDAEIELFAAIAKVRRGGVYVSPQLRDEMTKTVAAALRPARPPLPTVDRLTLREREILKLAAEGQTAKQIATLLCVSFRTVEHHRANVMAKLNLKGAAALVQYAVAHRYL